MGRMLQHFCLSLRVPTKETQRHSDVVQHDDGQACDSTQPALTELLRPSCEPTEVDERSAQENTTTPRDMVVQRRVRSVDDTDDYMIARARLLALSRRPTQHLNEINSSRSRSSGGKKGNTQVYSLQVRRAKCKNCQNVGHTPILQLHLLSSDPCVKGSTGTSRGRQQQHHVQCCVCNKIIASTQSFHGSTYENCQLCTSNIVLFDLKIMLCLMKCGTMRTTTRLNIMFELLTNLLCTKVRSTNLLCFQ